MKRVQFFYDEDLVALELKINEWLSANKEKKIVETNLNSLGQPRDGITNTEKYVFYILYSTAEWENILREKNAEEILSGTEQSEIRMNIEPAN
jgi:hypothetical protein